MELRTDNRILLIEDKYGNLVPFRMEKITDAILKAAVKVGGFGPDILPSVNQGLFEDRSDVAIATFLAHDVMGRLNGNPQFLTPNTPAPLTEVHRTVIHTLRFWGLRTVADEYQFYSSGREWIRRGALKEASFSEYPYPVDLVAEATVSLERLGCDTVEGLNEWVRSGRLGELIEAATSEYDAQLVRAAESFIARRRSKILLVTGPSSSGKTTTTHRLTRLVTERSGTEFVVFSADNYFYSVDQHPADQYGDRDYERARSYEIPLMRAHIQALLEGETVEVPRFDFKAGRRIGTTPQRLEAGQVLVIDCLHGLYPYITMGIPDDQKFRLFLCNANRIVRNSEGGEAARPLPFTLVNMLRRMLRDSKHRDKDLTQTLMHWHYVRDGELTDMLPFLRTADAYVNGGLAFDLPVLRYHLDARLEGPSMLPPGASLDAYLRAREARELLDEIAMPETDPDSLIPSDCHIREFIGGLSLQIDHQD